jgi:putative transposase
MSTEETHSRINVKDDGAFAGVERGEPGGRAARDAGAARRAREAVAGAELPPGVRDRLSDELIDELLAGARTEEEIVGPGGLLADLTRRLVERALSAELTEHLGYEPHEEPPGGTGNARNGTTPKTLATEHGPVAIKTPRDRKSTFEPQIVRKGQRRFEGFDDKILALYSRGLSVRDIEAHLHEIYGVKVGRDLISRVTDAVIEDARAWQQRPLEDVYPVVFLDCLVLKIREGGIVQRRACYLALGVTVEGDRDLLGMWFAETEGAKFWMQVLAELKQRGTRDILICCVDGLKGFPEAIEAIFPQTVVQTCIVHLIRHSLKYVPRRERERVARDLKPIYECGRRLGTSDVPQAHRPIVGGAGQGLPIRRERHPCYSAGVAFECGGRLAAGDVPQAHRPVVGGAGQGAPIPGERHAGHTGVTREHACESGWRLWKAPAGC